MRHKVTFISKRDLKQLQEFYNTASNIPLIINGYFDSKNADKAWNILKDFFIKLSEKYGYDWNQCKICPDGTVVTITKKESKKRLKSPKLFFKEEMMKSVQA